MKTIKLTGYSVAIALGIAFFVGCAKDEPAAIVLPPIGGFNSANEVGAADLLAYWPLEGNGIESKSSTAPNATVGASFEAGAKGQGVKLANGYLKYPAIAALSSNISAYTISAWVKLNNNKTASSATASTIFSIARPNEWIGHVNLYAETGNYAATIDTIRVKQGFGSTSGTEIYETFPKLEPWMVADNLITPGKHVANANKIGGQWAHLVATWSGTGNKLIIYSNGQKISSPAFEVRGTNTNIVFDAAAYPIIGAFGNFATTSDTWNKPMTGNIDEIRVWKKALSQADINALYELEKAGR
jgi:hypothetical protein